MRRAPNLGRALLWLAGYAVTRDWRNSAIEIVTVVEIDGDEVSLVNPEEYKADDK